MHEIAECAGMPVMQAHHGHSRIVPGDGTCRSACIYIYCTVRQYCRSTEDRLEQCASLSRAYGHLGAGIRARRAISIQCVDEPSRRQCSRECHLWTIRQL
jgi:hypothetical protein